jgi:energy-coupling factor transport system ATP-binding protein
VPSYVLEGLVVNNDEIIDIKEAEYAYKLHYEEKLTVKAVNNVSIKIGKGQFVAVLGRNGSGKSTLARLINALLLPDKGFVYIKGMDTRNEKDIWEIRRTAGMVFQNPDNQIVGTVVEEDVAFGPENLGIQPDEIRIRVDNAMKAVGILEYAKHAPHLLSGGQKQRVAIAGILSMKPECIILDEATSMLDPIGRKEVMEVLRKLNKENGITIVLITHHMDEASLADRIIVMDEGAVVLDAEPREVFSNVDRVKEMGLDVPQVTELFFELNKEGYGLPDGVLTVDEAVRALKDWLKG